MRTQALPLEGFSTVDFGENRSCGEIMEAATPKYAYENVSTHRPSIQYRVSSNTDSTTGTIQVPVDSGPILFQGSTLEAPPNAPQTLTSGPPLPIGQYPATVYDSPGLGYTDLLLQNTGSRTGIEIHIGNYPGDTHGCILPGKTVSTNGSGNNFVGTSATAFNTIMNIVNSTQAADLAKIPQVGGLHHRYERIAA